MSEERKETCKTCRFWEHVSVMGLCRRHAPRALIPSDSEEGFSEREPAWPLTCDDDWCGEYEYQREADVPRVYVSNDFHGMFPVGTAAVVVASSEFEARKLLEEKITWTDDKSFSLREISKVESSAHILHDGNY